MTDFLDQRDAARAQAELAQPAIRSQYDLNTGIRHFEEQLLALIHMKLPRG